MAAIFWPGSLPKTLFINGLSAKRKTSVIRTAMDAGPKKTRRRYTASTKDFTGKMLLNSEQRLTLEQFYDVTLAGGVYRFNFTDPQTLVTAEFRFREEYTENSADGLFEITMQLERLS